MTERLPPHEQAAEKSVLGSILRDPDIFPNVRGTVSADSFYFDQHRILFAALDAMHEARKPIDLVTVHCHLEAAGKLDDVKDAYLGELWTSVATGADAEYHAKLVRDAATTRRLIHATTEILRDAYDRVYPIDDMMANAERRLFAIANEHVQTRGTARPIREVLREVMQSIDDRAALGGSLAGIATGFSALDEMTGGLRPGELVVIGARPSVGKTALALNIAVNCGQPTFLVSLEMPAGDIGARLLTMGSGVSMHRITRGVHLTPDDVDALIVAAGPKGIGGTPLFVDDLADQPPTRIASVARRLVRQYGIKLIVVDYLQLMRPENPKENRTQQVGMLALRMKNLARDCNVPVILLSQLNRELEHANRSPRLSDLRESGDIEAHADRVFLLHREANQPPHAEAWIIDVYVAKQRNGPVGDLQLAYVRSAMRFENHAGMIR